jgi:hypothetical protein
VWQIIESGREVYFQDGVEWIERDHVDVLVPMIYTTSAERFRERLGSYTRRVDAHKIIAGLGPYLEGFTDSLLAEQIAVAGSSGIGGYCIFNSDFAMKYGDILRGYAPRPSPARGQ